MTAFNPRIRTMRGAASLMVILILVVVIAAIGAGWWFLMGPGSSDSKMSAAPPAASTQPVDAETDGTAAPVISPAVEELSVDQLFRESRKAMSEERLVAPAGNNALEYYLAILDKDPSNSGAKDALRELFPFATGTVDREINQGNIDEANRIIGLLAKSDPSNYSLTILRSKMEARRKLAERDEIAQAAQAAAAAARAAAPVASTPAPVTAPEAASTPAATPAPAPAPVATPAPAPVVAPVAARGETRDAEVVSPVRPSYPPQAARSRTEGYVVVEFTVAADGAVQNPKVVRADPARVFDREAIRAVERSKFKPRLENGTPVSSTVTRRIEFQLGN